MLRTAGCGVCRRCLTGRLAYCEDLFGRNFGGSRTDGTTALATLDGSRVSSTFFGQSSFATYANVAERSVVKVDADVDLTIAAPLGCGIQTGAGAVLNEMRPRPGSSFIVFGTGAVGGAAVMGAVVAGCTTIIAVDLVASRLELALEIGATHVIDAGTEDVAARVAEITGGRGMDYALDTTGVPGVLRQAADTLGIGGTVALVGAAAPGTEVSFEIGLSLIKGWTFTTSIEGSAVPQVFLPALIALHKQGRFPFDKLVRTYPFAQINEAFEDSETGRTVKPIIVF